MASVLLFSLFKIWIYFCARCESIVQLDSFACSCPAFPTSFIEKDFFPHCIFLTPLLQIACTSVGSSLGSLLCSINLCVCFCASTILLGFPGGASGKEPACQCRRCKNPWVQSLGREDPLEEGMATHASILAWRSPWAEKPMGIGAWQLQSMGPQGVRHDWSNLACA